MKKIKQKLPAALLILLAMLLIPGITHAKTEYQGKLWNFKKTVKKTSGAFTYYAYPSKNQKEAWIYRIDIKKSGKNCSALSIPSKLDNKKVTRLGSRAIRQRDSDEEYNIFDVAVEPWHPYNNGDYARSNRIKKLVIPNTVKIIQPTAFSGMDSIKEVKIPKSVKTLDLFTFYHCDKLEKIELPAGLKKFEKSAFRNCPKLTKIKLPSSNKTYQVKNNCVVTKKEKELIFAPSCKQTLQIPEGVKTLKQYAFSNCIAKEVHIPASVEKIERGAFSRGYDHEIGRVDNVTVDEKNSVFARDGQCIYNKIDKSLSIIIRDQKGNLYISDQVERLTADWSVIGPKYLRVEGKSKVVYPKTLKTVVDNHFICAENIYFTSDTLPSLVKENTKKITGPPDGAHVYVPEGSAEVYRQWYQQYKIYDQLNGFDTFKPDDKI